MTIGVLLDQVSLNPCFYEKLDNDSAAKFPGIGLFTLLALNMPLLWPICCRQLHRLIDEEGGFLKTIKILIGLFDFRHSEDFHKEKTQECDDLVASVLERAGENMDLSIVIYVSWIQQAHMRDNDKN